jgi:hypothetical protein
MRLFTKINPNKPMTLQGFADRTLSISAMGKPIRVKIPYPTPAYRTISFESKIQKSLTDSFHSLSLML